MSAAEGSNRMTTADTAAVEAVRDHYDQVSVFYKALWGEHIHHGYWLGNETPAQAQLQLMQLLAEQAAVPRHACVLDVGCGLGGSARWLAANLDCRVLGITISPQQVRMAGELAQRQSLAGRVSFRLHDAHNLDALGQRFDVIWILECSEHLHERAAFFDACGRLLRPGGVLATCAWFRGEQTPEDDPLLRRVCHGMLCPTLSTMSEYDRYLRGAGLSVTCSRDITVQVRPTWTKVERLVGLPGVKLLLRTADRSVRDFVDACGLMGRAYDEGVMAYGMMAARR
jgi:tocopherol O-methyltransferase